MFPNWYLDSILASCKYDGTLICLLNLVVTVIPPYHISDTGFQPEPLCCYSFCLESFPQLFTYLLLSFHYFSTYMPPPQFPSLTTLSQVGSPSCYSQSASNVLYDSYNLSTGLSPDSPLDYKLLENRTLSVLITVVTPKSALVSDT